MTTKSSQAGTQSVGASEKGGSAVLGATIRYFGQAQEVGYEARRSAQHLINETRRLFRKPGAFWGVQRTFQPTGGGQAVAAQRKMPSVTTRDQLTHLGRQLADLLDIGAMEHWTASQTFVDIVVDGKPLLRGVPYSYLPFLQTQLEELYSVLKLTPTIAMGQQTSYDNSIGAFRYEPIMTQSKGVSGQSDGNWQTIRYAAALPQQQVLALRQSCEKVLSAVIAARGESGARPIQDVHPSREILGAILGNVPELGWSGGVTSTGQSSAMGTSPGQGQRA